MEHPSKESEQAGGDHASLPSLPAPSPLSLRPLQLRSLTVSPPLFAAPMAGITNSAFRRLLADFGHYGALFTEMLSAKQVLKDDLKDSPHLKRRPAEGPLFYQLMVQSTDFIEAALMRLTELNPDGLDINLACHAPKIRNVRAGSSLFEDAEALRHVLTETRRCWNGPLTVKIRLGSERPGWRDRLAERLRIIEEAGVDAVFFHPRFFEDKFRRYARHEELAGVTALTRLPVMVNGDLVSRESVTILAPKLAPASGLMFGRILAVQPWFFAALDGPVRIDYAEVWHRLFTYTCEDFPPDEALESMKLFSNYYARNFMFGHTFAHTLARAETTDEIRKSALEFLRYDPHVLKTPSLQGF